MDARMHAISTLTSTDEKSSQTWTRMAATERELLQEADSFLAHYVTNGHLTEAVREEISHWLRSRLETERHGWKGKLQMALQEVERERKMALEVHATIERIGERVSRVLGAAGLHREPSMYASCEHDVKMYELASLDRDVEMIVTAVATLQQDNDRCREHLARCEDVSEYESVYDALEHFVSMQIAKMKKITAEGQELQRQVELLTETLELHRTVSEQEKAEFERTEGELRALIKEQRRRSFSEMVHQATQVDEAVATTRDCCIQVDAPARPAQSFFSASSSDVMPLPVTMVTVSKAVAASTAEGRKSNSIDPGAMQHDNAMDYLQKQVMHFAEKLEKSRWQMEVYQRQLAWLRIAPQRAANIAKRSRGTDETHWQAAEGYLGGMKKLVLPPVDQSCGGGVTSRWTPRTNGLPTVAMRRCTRCAKMYKVKENHKLSCRYHPKTQQKIEKFDSSGKLIRVTHLWECCMQRTDAPGCSVDQHT